MHFGTETEKSAHDNQEVSQKETAEKKVVERKGIFACNCCVAGLVEAQIKNSELQKPAKEKTEVFVKEWNSCVVNLHYFACEFMVGMLGIKLLTWTLKVCSDLVRRVFLLEDKSFCAGSVGT